MSHQHQLVLNGEMPQTGRIIDLMSDTVGLRRHDRNVTITDLVPPGTNDGTVHLLVELAVTRPDQRLRNRQTTFQFHILDYSRYEHPDERTPPAVEVWGSDPFGLAALANVAEVLGGHVNVYDDRPSHYRTMPGNGADTARIVERADVVAAAEAINGTSPHRPRVPALARAGVPALAA